MGYDALYDEKTPAGCSLRQDRRVGGRGERALEIIQVFCHHLDSHAAAIATIVKCNKGLVAPYHTSFDPFAWGDPYLIL